MSDNDDKTVPLDAAVAADAAVTDAVAADAEAADADAADALVADADDTEVLDAAADTVEADTAAMGAPRTGPLVSDARETTAPPPAAPTPPWSITITTDASSAGAGAVAAHYGRPRTRWAAIVWGLIIAAIAATTLAIVGSPARRLALSDWASTLTPGAFWILSVLVVGVFILLLAVLALIRRAQRRRVAA